MHKHLTYSTIKQLLGSISTVSKMHLIKNCTCACSQAVIGTDHASMHLSDNRENNHSLIIIN